MTNLNLDTRRLGELWLEPKRPPVHQYYYLYLMNYYLDLTVNYYRLNVDMPDPAIELLRPDHGQPDLEYYLEMTGEEFDLREILLPRMPRRC